MSSIPEAAMPHAKAHHDPAPEPAKTSADKTGGIIAAVKAHPVAAVAVGATVVAGAVAAAAPLLRDAKPAKPKKSAAKKKAAS